MDVKWIVDEQMNMVANGGCKYAAVSGILNAMAMAEADTVQQYEYGRQAISKLLDGEPDKCEVVSKLIRNVVQDEMNHTASFNKASAIIGGYNEPKPDEYNKAVKK